MPFISAMNPDAAVQATSNAIKAKTDLLPFLELTPYSHIALLAHATTFVPAANTIIMTSFLTGIGAADKFRLQYDAHRIFANKYNFENYHTSLISPIFCDGTHIGFENQVGTQQTLSLFGVVLI